MIKINLVGSAGLEGPTVMKLVGIDAEGNRFASLLVPFVELISIKPNIQSLFGETLKEEISLIYNRIVILLQGQAGGEE